MLRTQSIRPYYEEHYLRRVPIVATEEQEQQAVPIVATEEQEQQQAGEPGDVVATEIMVDYHGHEVPASCNLTQSHLDALHPHARDRRIAFSDDGHRYFVDGKLWSTSVTSWVGEHFEDYDYAEAVTAVTSSPAFATGERGNAQYAHIAGRLKRGEITMEEVQSLIKEQWEQAGTVAAELGTGMHLAIEHYYNAKAGGPAPPPSAATATREWGQFLHYYDIMKGRGLVPFRTEMRVFSERYDICGSVDMIFVDEAGKYYLRDWKRSAKITDRGRGRALVPFERHTAGKYLKYSIQLHVYKTILEMEYGMMIEDMKIVAFHPSLVIYRDQPVMDVAKEVEEMFRLRLEATKG